MTERKLNLMPFRKGPLFAGLTEQELAQFAALWQAQLFCFAKGEQLDRGLARQAPGQLTCLLSGGALIQKNDAEGNQAILDFARPWYLMGCYSVLTDMPFHGLCIVATAPGLLLTFRPEPVSAPGTEAHALQVKLQRNMMGLLAQHGWQLMKKAEILSCHSLRAKTLAFLSAQREYFHSDVFEVPMDRQTLADYLYINRSALSRELGRLREEGLIEYHRSKFVLHFPPSTL